MSATTAIEKYWWGFVLLATALIAWGAGGRAYLGFGVENDLFMQYLPEAQRVLDGEPLQLPYHPPIYPVLLALTTAAVGDWLTAGVVISIVSMAAAMCLGYSLFRAMCGTAAAVGALVGLAGSSAALTHAGLASSDMLYLALFLGAAYVAVAATQRASARLWFLAGVVVGAAMLTRTNGVSLLAVVLFPWLLPRSRLRGSALVLAGVAAALALWAAIALVTGSRFAPQGSHVSLAYHFYHQDLLFDDARALLGNEFVSAWDVVARDPMLVLKTYVRGFYDVLQTLFTAGFTLDAPLNLLVLPGLVYLLATSNRVFVGYLVLIVVPQLLLLNLAIADERYYLYVVPLFGAAVAGTFTLLLAVLGGVRWRRSIASIFALCALVALVSAGRDAGRSWSASVAELEQAIPAVEAAATQSTVLIARKEHVSHYAGVAYAWLPRTLAELESEARRAVGRDVLVYLGSEEGKLRPEIAALAAADEPPPWLEVVARGRGSVRWVLLRYRPGS